MSTIRWAQPAYQSTFHAYRQKADKTWAALCSKPGAQCDEYRGPCDTYDQPLAGGRVCGACRRAAKGTTT